ncbi:uncharacterized protein LOC100205628 [Hydra vulgaris]|uniref:Uncharacterized protein LOC100205628 n=1 Tax=Hydra vulgaris TaxID=6087 RepID=A0ABM4B805_HYDVU
MENKLPIIDFSPIFSKCLTSEALWQHLENDKEVQEIIKNFRDGFCTWGFIYIKGHGIDESDIKTVNKKAKQFFNFPLNFKNNYFRGNGIALGYVPVNGEKFTDKRPFDIKEALDYLPSSNLSKNLYTKFPDFVNTLNEFFDKSSNLVYIILRVLAVALGLNTEHFVKMHSSMGNHSKNGTTMRLLYYPEVIKTVSNEQLRCSEHTDYGTLTMLFQDAVGGLEVLSPFGEFVPVTPIPGTVVINGGDLLEAWSNGKFKATLHKVSLTSLASPRQSVAFFTHPNYDTDITYVDEFGIKHIRNAREHLEKRFLTTIY